MSPDIAPLNATAAVVVRGAPTADEIAAVLAALARAAVPASLARRAGGPGSIDDPYERWRRGRIAALARAAGSR